MAIETWADLATFTKTGTADAPSSGTSESWTDVTSCTLPAVSTSGTPPTSCYLRDTASGAQSELIEVTSCTGSGATSATVTRGANGTTPVSHAASAVYELVVTTNGMEQTARVDWINAVTMFGADPTGSADSWSAIQNALLSFGTLYQATQGHGGVVYLPEGDYIISKTLVVPSSVCLRGAGKNSTQILLITGSNCDMIQWSSYESASQATLLGVSDTAIGNAFYSSVQDLNLHGDSFHTTTAGYCHGINITSNPASGSSTAPTDPETDLQPYIANVTIEACTGDGFYMDGRSAGTLYRVLSEYNNGNGFSVSYDTFINNCLAYNNAITGFYLNFGSDEGVNNEAANNGVNGSGGDLWTSGYAYSAGSIAIYSNALYFCISAVTSSTPPSSDATHWTHLTTATSPQWWGVGFMWDSGAVEHTWMSCNAQENANSNYYIHDATSINLTGVSNRPNFNAGSNSAHNATVTLDDATGCFVQMSSSNLSADAGYVANLINASTNNTLVLNSDGTESAFLAPSSQQNNQSKNRIIGNGGSGLIQVFNVTDPWFGADPTGTNDSTTAVQAAINAANTAGGGTVYFPAGTYKITSALTVYSYITYLGDGDQISIVKQTTTTANAFTGTDVTRVSIRDLQLLGPSSGSGKGIAFGLSSHTNTGFLNFTDVLVQDFGSDGININTPIVSVFNRVVSQSNGGNGWTTTSSTSSTSCTWNSCYANANTGYGYSLSTQCYSSLNGCAADSNGNGYYLSSCQSVSLNGCGAESTTTDSFILTGGYGNSLHSPRVYSNGHYGIHLTGSETTCTIIGAVDNTPAGGAANFIITDSGTSGVIIDQHNTTANSIGGNFQVFDGSTFSLGAGAAIKFGSSADTDLYRLGSNSLATDGLFTAYGGLAAGGQTELAAGTTTVTPLLFQSGTLNTTPAAGAAEYDGKAFYLTAAASSRQVNDAEQFLALSSSYTLTNSTSAQKLFNATSNGTLTLQGATSYFFEAEFDITGLSSSTHTFSFGFGGTATFTSLKYLADVLAPFTAGTFASWGSAIFTAATAQTFVASGTNTSVGVRIKGILRVNAAGTIIPQITQGTASAAAVVSANSYFRIWPVGSNTVTNVGDWS